MDDTLAKPIRMLELDAVLRRWLGAEDDAGKPAPVEELGPASACAIDPATLEALRDLEDDAHPGFVAQVLQVFLDSAATTLRALQAAVAVGDAAQLRAAAHSLKGASASIGGAAVAARCAELERLDDLDAAGSRELLDGLEQELGRLRREAEEVIAAPVA
jgi:HPt (histidine-containing phosphotransfer) domain-containing protein